MYADSEEDKQNISVVSAGKGAEHTRIGILNFPITICMKKCKLKQAGRAV